MISLDHTTAEALLDTWEQGWSVDNVCRALLMLKLSTNSDSFEPLLVLPVGERDRLLFQFRQQLFGDRLESVTDCPECESQVELRLSVAELLEHYAVPSSDTVSVDYGEQRRDFRLPNSNDLLAIGQAVEEERPRALMNRCTKDGLPQREEVDSMPLEAVAEQFKNADPLADLQVSVACSECAFSWSSKLDIVQFLWDEIDNSARRLLCEIHTLASVYGWAEQRILAMSAWRRQLYLEMIRQ